MCDHDHLVLCLPELSDEAVVAVHRLLEDLATRFEGHYFSQMHRYHQELKAQRRPHSGAPFDPARHRVHSDDDDLPF